MTYSNFLTQSLKEASKIARDNFEKVLEQTKGTDNNQVLTETDLAVGRMFIQKIKHDFPDYNIIDEEAGVIDNGSEFTWVIDPVDGTSNYAKGLPTYGIMIGLLKGDKPIAGGITLPYFDEIAIAELGKGTFINGKKASVSDSLSLKPCLVSYGIDGHPENPEYTYKEVRILAEIVLNIRNLRTSNSVFDIIQVTKGKYGAMLNQTSKIWDNVAPQIIIEEAGGIYSDFFGNPIDYSNPLSKASDNFTFCAASKALHRELQDIIHKT